jgi:hypothetical protein
MDRMRSTISTVKAMLSARSDSSIQGWDVVCNKYQ